MANDSPTLDDLRAAIDRMDKDIHDMLMQRISITDQIAAYKNRHTPGEAKMRPGREAVILRKLVARHDGALTEQSLARLWREIMSAVVAMQEPFRVVVAEADDPVAYWDLARFHYGTQPHVLAPSALDVLGECGKDRTVVGVVPAPVDGEDDPWWLHMRGPRAGDTKVFGRLPFLVDGGNGPVAYTIGQMPLEPSGDDLTWLVLEVDGVTSRSRVQDWLNKAGLTGHVVATNESHKPALTFFLVEADGFLDETDPGLAALKSAGGKALAQVSRIGVMARPLSIKGA